MEFIPKEIDLMIHKFGCIPKGVVFRFRDGDSDLYIKGEGSEAFCIHGCDLGYFGNWKRDDECIMVDCRLIEY